MNPGSWFRVAAATLVAAATAPSWSAAEGRTTELRLDLGVEANVGQARPGVLFVAPGGRRCILFGRREIVIHEDVTPETDAAGAPSRRRPSNKDRTFASRRIELHPRGPDVDVVGVGLRRQKANRFIGDDASKWITGAPVYDGVEYRGIADDVDLVFDGATGLSLRGSGVRELLADARGVRDGRGCMLLELLGDFSGAQLRPDSSGDVMALGSWLTWGTYYGGTDAETIIDVDVGAAGSIFAVGRTTSVDLPIVGGVQSTFGGLYDAFVVRFDPSLQSLAYSTYLGGMDWEQGSRLRVMSDDSVVVCGNTTSYDFPTVSPLQSTHVGPGFDGWFAKLSPSGSSLVFSSYLGGSDDDSAADVTVLASGDFLLAGVTSSLDFPTSSPLYSTGYGFVARIAAAGDRFIYSTHMPAGMYAIAVDGVGNALVGGQLWGAGYPVVNAVQPTWGGAYDRVLSKLTADGSALLFSTYLGGSGNESIYGGVAIDDAGNHYVSGDTDSTDFPTFQPFQSVNRGLYDMYAVKLTPAGDAFVYSTYLGGQGDDYGAALAVAADDSIHLAGVTTSADYPLVLPVQPTPGGSYEACVTKFAPDGASILFSSYLGGPYADGANCVAVDQSSSVYVGGSGYGLIPDPLLPPASVDEAFVAKIFIPPTAPYNLVTGPGPDPAAPPRVRAYDVLGQPSAATDFMAYGVLRDGVNVSAGAIDAAPEQSIITGPGPGPVFGPHVRAFRTDGTPVSPVSFYAYGTLRFGVSVIGADVDADTLSELVTGAGPGAVFGPHVRGFDYDGGAVAALPGLSVFAYGTLRYGVNVGRGPLTGNDRDEILTMPGPSSAFASQVRGFRFSGSTSALQGLSFVAFGSATHGGRVDGADLDADGRSEIVAGAGPAAGNSAAVKGFVYDGNGIAPLAGLDFIALLGTYGAEPHGTDLDGDVESEIVVSGGPDPTLVGRVRGFEHTTTVAPFPSLDLAPYATYGLHAAGASLGL